MPVNERVLLLNASWEPICVVTIQRAVILVLAEKAEIVEERDNVLRSESLSFNIPSVIRLIKFVKVPKFRKAYLSRRNVLARDGYECCYCGDKITLKTGTMDHVYPRYLGGRHHWKNVVACCFTCNQIKGHKTLEELGWKMRFKPTEPVGHQRVVLIVGSNAEEWEQYLAYQ